MDQQEQARFFAERLGVKDAEIARLRAELAEARAERDAAIRERDEARTRIVEQIKASIPHALENAKAVYEYEVDEGRARAMATLIVDEALQCLRFDDVRDALRAHAARAGKGGENG